MPNPRAGRAGRKPEPADLARYEAARERGRQVKDLTEARAIAKEIVDLDAFPEYAGLGLGDLVAEVDRAREAGDAERVAELDLYLLAKFPPQRIVGKFRGS